MIPQRPKVGKLAPEIERLVFNIVQEISNLDSDIETYLEMLKTCPLLGTILDVQTLIALASVGEYSNPDEGIQDFIQSQLRNMQGSFSLSFAELFASKALGYVFSEIAMERKDQQWILDSIMALNPLYYLFEGAKGKVTGVNYESQRGTIRIPIERGIHVKNQGYLTYGDPYGVATLKRCVSAWRAWKILMGQMLIAGQRQSTGVIVGYAPSEDSVPMFEADGSPMLDSDGNQVTLPAPDALSQQMQGLENGSILSTDLKNRIEVLNQQTEGTFFFKAIDLCERLMMVSFAFPNTILSTASSGSGLASGDSNLNEGHRGILELTVNSTKDLILEEILEKVIRPIIYWNFGEQEDYGEFKPREADQENKIALIQALTNAVATGFFSAADQDVIDRGRDLLGLPRTEEIITAQTNREPVQLSKAPRKYWA